MFKYWGFGLHILSGIEFPELLPAEFDAPDVTIEYGKVPDKLEGEGITRRPFSWLTRDEYILHLKHVSHYYAAHGNRIVVEPVEGIDIHSVRLFLLGTIMAAILYQRGCIPFHASAVVKDGKLIIFAGNSGAGKSTMLACLMRKGYEIFTDDVCVMHQHPPGRTGVFCTASYPMIKLWDDAITSLNSEMYTRDFKIRPELPKYGQFFFDSFNRDSLPVNKIFILIPRSIDDKTRIRKLTAVQAFKQLSVHAYKKELITGTQVRNLHFSLLTEISSTYPVYEITRPAKGVGVEDIYETILNLL